MKLVRRAGLAMLSVLAVVASISKDTTGTLLNLKQLEIIEKQERMLRPAAKPFNGATPEMMGSKNRTFKGFSSIMG